MELFLISGATSPLGLALTNKLSELGISSTLIVNKKTTNNGLIKKLKGETLDCDLSCPRSVDILCNEIERSYTSFSAFVHLAATAPEDDYDIGVLGETFNVNVFSGWRIAKTCIAMMERAIGGRILFVGSVGQKFGGKNARAGYAASKFLLEYFPKYFRECGANGILVNTLRLGVMEGGTQTKTDVSSSDFTKRVDLIPTRTCISHAEAVKNILFLCSEENKSIHNSVLTCSGGE